MLHALPVKAVKMQMSSSHRLSMKTKQKRASGFTKMMQQERTVTAEERDRAAKAARAFQPVKPFCRVVLRPSYLYTGCILVNQSQFLAYKGFMKLQSAGGKQWPVRCNCRRRGKAKLSQGWYEFTLENNLSEGDVCVLELLESRDIVLKVTMIRVSETAGLGTVEV